MAEQVTALTVVQDESMATLAFMDRASVTFAALMNSGTSLLPASVQTVGDAVVAAAFGRRFGMDPMSSIYNIHVIEGRPTLRADAIVGLCKARRDLCRYFHLVESSDKVATYETLREGDPGPTKMSFTYAEAEQAGLTKPTRSGKESNWKRFPAAMCRARASTALARAVYPDLVGGIYYPGEVNDDEGFVGVEGVPDVLVKRQAEQAPRSRQPQALRHESNPPQVLPADTSPQAAPAAPVDEPKPSPLMEQANRLAARLPGGWDALDAYARCKDGKAARAKPGKAFNALMAGLPEGARADLLTSLEERTSVVEADGDVWPAMLEGCAGDHQKAWAGALERLGVGVPSAPLTTAQIVGGVLYLMGL